MKYLTIIVCMVLVGCESIIYPGEVEAARQACAEFGGVKWFTASGLNMARGPYKVTAYCVDHTEVTFTLRPSVQVE